MVAVLDLVSKDTFWQAGQYEQASRTCLAVEICESDACTLIPHGGYTRDRCPVEFEFLETLLLPHGVKYLRTRATHVPPWTSAFGKLFR